MKPQKLDHESKREGHQHLIKELLSIFDFEYTNDPSSPIWRFKNFDANFHVVTKIKEEYPGWANTFQVDLMEFTKVIFLFNISKIRSSLLIRYRFDSIIKTLYYLASSNKTSITAKDLDSYLSFQLLHGIQSGNLVIRSTPFSWKNFNAGLQPQDWILTCRKLDLPNSVFHQNISSSLLDKSFNRIIPEITDGGLTVQDWKDGGDFNKLTLDYGQYYVDFSIRYFDQNILIAIALKRTITKALQITKEAGILVSKDSLKSYVMLLISHFVAGKELSKLTAPSKRRHSIEWLENLRNATHQELQKNLLTLYAIQAVTSDSFITELRRRLEIDEDDRSAISVIRFIACSHLYRKYVFCDEVAITLIDKDLENLKNSKHFDTTRKVTDLLFDECLMKNLSPKIDETFFALRGIKESGSQSKYALNYIKAVEDAGIIKFMALTGWRASEFGFPLKQIAVTKNIDSADRIDSPSSFKVNWMVPKTHGDVKLHREISRELFYTAILIAELINAKGESPCLYSYNYSAMHIHKSAEFIKKAVGNLWSNFVQNYEPFKALRDFKRTGQFDLNANFSSIENTFLSLDKEQRHAYDSSPIERDILLIAAFNRAEKEFSRVNFLLNSDLRRNFLWKYKNKVFPKDQQEMIDEFLPEALKEKIDSLDSTQTNSPIFIREITNELLSGCLYPTPHSLRHMWAEAVYRRFDGDVGWMIRSNFKHISQNMWLAYIKDKDNRSIHLPAKRAVISSVLHNYISKKGNGYAGATEKYLRRLFLNTHISSIDNLDEFVANVAANEIEDIKSNPWGFCILRSRNKHIAKCSEEGIPQRFSASPSLCLGCSFNLTQSANVEEILLGIENNVKVLENPRSPLIFKQESQRVISNALAQLEKLKCPEEITNKLRSHL